MVIRLIAMSILTLLLLSACLPYNQPSQSESAASDVLPVWTAPQLETEVAQTIGDQTAREETLKIATDRLSDGWMSPLLTSSGKKGPLNLIYEPLLRYDPENDRYVAAFAAHWHHEAGTLHFTTDPEKRWHDGSEASLSDVIYALELYQRMQLEPRLQTMRLAVEDEEHLSISFGDNVPEAEMTYVLSRLLIVPRHIFSLLESQLGENVDLKTGLVDTNLIGSGSYRLKSLDEFALLLEETSELDDLPRYIEIPRYGDTEARQRALSTGQVDLWYGSKLDRSDVSSIQSNETLYSIWLNGSSEKLADVLVRQALGRAFRRILVASRLDVGSEYRFLSYQYFGSQDEATYLATDLAASEPRYASQKVSELMQAAGKEKDDRGFYVLTQNGQPLELIFLDRPGVQPALEQFTLEVRSLGFNVRMIPLDEKDFAKRREAMDYDLIFDVALADDRNPVIERRVRHMLRHLDAEEKAPYMSTIDAALGALYANESELRYEAKSTLAREIQRLSIVFMVDIAPEGYLNLNRSVWSGDMLEAAGSTSNADPFGENWRRVLNALESKAIN